MITRSNSMSKKSAFIKSLLLVFFILLTVYQQALAAIPNTCTPSSKKNVGVAVESLNSNIQIINNSVTLEENSITEFRLKFTFDECVVLQSGLVDWVSDRYTYYAGNWSDYNGNKIYNENKILTQIKVHNTTAVNTRRSEIIIGSSIGSPGNNLTFEIGGVIKYFHGSGESSLPYSLTVTVEDRYKTLEYIEVIPSSDKDTFLDALPGELYFSKANTVGTSFAENFDVYAKWDNENELIKVENDLTTAWQIHPADEHPANTLGVVDSQGLFGAKAFPESEYDDFVSLFLEAEYKDPNTGDNNDGVVDIRDIEYRALSSRMIIIRKRDAVGFSLTRFDVEGGYDNISNHGIADIDTIYDLFYEVVYDDAVSEETASIVNINEIVVYDSDSNGNIANNKYLDFGVLPDYTNNKFSIKFLRPSTNDLPLKWPNINEDKILYLVVRYSYLGVSLETNKKIKLRYRKPTNVFARFPDSIDELDSSSGFSLEVKWSDNQVTAVLPGTSDLGAATWWALKNDETYTDSDLEIEPIANQMLFPFGGFSGNTFTSTLINTEGESRYIEAIVRVDYEFNQEKYPDIFKFKVYENFYGRQVLQVKDVTRFQTLDINAGQEVVGENQENVTSFTALFSDFSNNEVSPPSAVPVQWILEDIGSNSPLNSNIAQINALGELSTGSVTSPTAVRVVAKYNLPTGELTSSKEVLIDNNQKIVQSLEILGQVSVSEDSPVAENYLAKVHFDDSKKIVIAKWNIDDEKFATIDNNTGVLSTNSVTADQAVTIRAQYLLPAGENYIFAGPNSNISSLEVVVENNKKKLQDIEVVNILETPPVTGASGNIALTEGSSLSGFSVDITTDQGTINDPDVRWETNSPYASVDSSGTLTAGKITKDSTIVLSARSAKYGQVIESSTLIDLVDNDSYTESISGAPANGSEDVSSRSSVLNANDGRYVVFASKASLVGDDTNSKEDIYLRDRENNQLIRISVDSSGIQGLGDSSNPDISDDGQFIVFESDSRLSEQDLNDNRDIYLHDRDFDEDGVFDNVSVTTLISTNSNNESANESSFSPVISGNGNVIAFSSRASNLIEDDSNDVEDIFVLDRLNNSLSVIKSAVRPEYADGASVDPAISKDGNFIAFSSLATNLIYDDGNDTWDVYRLDRVDTVIERVSESSAGIQFAAPSTNPSISDSGAVVAFQRDANDLPSGDNFQIFVRDFSSTSIKRINLSGSSINNTGSLVNALISGNGRFILFDHEYVDGGSNSLRSDVVLYDRYLSEFSIQSVNNDQTTANASGRSDSLSEDGRFITFSSSATNLSANDGNQFSDVFLRDRGQLPNVVNVSLVSEVFSSRANDVVNIELWMDMSGDTALGGGLDFRYDPQLIAYQGFNYAEDLGADPNLFYPGEILVNEDQGLITFGNFEGITGNKRIGTFIFKIKPTATETSTTFGLASNVWPMGQLRSVVTKEPMLVGYTDFALNIYRDTDGDNLSDSEELNLSTSITNNDTDSDGLNDWGERSIGSDPFDADTDNDGLNDYEEFVAGTSTIHWDTDGDGVADNIDRFPVDNSRSELTFESEFGYVYEGQAHYVDQSGNSIQNAGKITIKDVAVDDSGNVYQAGSFINTVDFDPNDDRVVERTALGSGGEIFVSKTDRTGQLLWVRTSWGNLSSSVNALAIDSVGNVHVVGRVGAGSFSESESFNTTLSGEYINDGRTIRNTIGTDAFYMKLNPEGAITAFRFSDSFAQHVYFNDIAIDANDEIYIVGNFTTGTAQQYSLWSAVIPTLGGSTGFILKLNHNSVNLQWHKTIGHANGEAYILQLAVDSQNAVYVSGYFSGSIDINSEGNEKTSAGLTDGFVASLTTEGDYRWLSTVGGSGNDRVHSINLRSNDIQILGAVFGAAQFDDAGSEFLGQAGVYNSFLTYREFNGTYINTLMLPMTSSEVFSNLSIISDRDDNYYIFGDFKDQTDFNPDEGTGSAGEYIREGIGGNNDVFLTKYDANNAWEEALVFGGSGSDSAHSIDISTIGDVYMGGEFTGEVDFYPEEIIAGDTHTSDRGPNSYLYTLFKITDTDGDGTKDRLDEDDDDDNYNDIVDAFPLDPSEWADLDGDRIGDNSDLDIDGDGVDNINDPAPFDALRRYDTDGNGVADLDDTDDDGDGYDDPVDAFPLDKDEWLNTDGDALGNNADPDDDNDGVVDEEDAFPLDPTESLNTDGDVQGNNADPDDDNDGVLDDEDAFPLDPTESLNTDGDSLGNNADPDDDNDGVLDDEDAFPLDPTESLNTDGDALGNNADPDDDDDGVLDEEDVYPLDPTEWANTDGDELGDNSDPDADNDGVLDEFDDMPLDSTETVNTDGDALGNNADLDDDNDGVPDEEDAFPLDPTEWANTDGDQWGDNSDPDADNDGRANEADAFPLDPTEQDNTDGDELGNNADDDDDGDSVRDIYDDFPLNAAEQLDLDGDGFGNNSDEDDDGDNVDDPFDAYPLDAARWESIGYTHEFDYVTTTGAKTVEDIAVDSLGNIIEVGNFTGIVDFDERNPGIFVEEAGEVSHDTSADGYVLKKDSNGNVLWVWRTDGYTTTIKSIAISSTDEIIVVGYFSGGNQRSVRFPSNPEKTLYFEKFDPRGTNAFYMRLEPNGQRNLLKFVSDTTANITPRNVAVDNQGNFYIVGNFTKWTVTGTDSNLEIPFHSSDKLAGIGPYNLYVTKYDYSGTYQWTHRVGGENGSVSEVAGVFDGHQIYPTVAENNVAVDINGNVVVSGTFNGELDFNAIDSITNENGETLYDPNHVDRVIRSSNGGTDGFVFQLSPDGTFNWVYQTNWNGGDEAQSIEANESIHSIAVQVNQIYVLGSVRDVVTLDGNQFGRTGKYSSYLSKLNLLGEREETILLPLYSESRLNKMSITLNQSGDYFVAGNFERDVEFNPLLGNPDAQIDRKINNESGDIFITKYFAEDTYGWTKTFGDDPSVAATGWPKIAGVALAGTGEIHVAGTFTGVVDFDPSSGESGELTQDLVHTYSLRYKISPDFDGDDISDEVDNDDDNDGVLDDVDAFPNDRTETVDTDADGVGNNADQDDDGDRINDNVDEYPLDPAPDVSAGADQVVDEQTVVTVIGSAFDNGTILERSWRQINEEVGAITLTVDTEDPNKATFTAPVTTVPLQIELEFSATDDAGVDVGATSFDTTTIYVNPVNALPTVAIQAPSNEFPENTYVVLTSESIDMDGEIVSWQWEQVVPELSTYPIVPVGNLSGISSPEISFYTPEVALDTFIEFKVTVTDNEGGTATANSVFEIHHVNTLPWVDVGPDIVVDERKFVGLASMSGDPDGSIESYSWTQINGPTVTLDGIDTSYVSFAAPTVASTSDVILQLTVTDNEGGTANDAVIVTVNNINQPPNVVTPDNQENLEGDSVLLDIVATDLDGDLLAFSATDLPLNLNINSTTGIIEGILGIGTAGTYEVIVNVSDGVDATFTSFIWNVRVPPEDNSVPAANDDIVSAPIGGSIVFDVLANDTDADVGDVLSVTSFTQPTYGVTSQASDGRILYESINGVPSNEDIFTYTITDANGGTSSASVTVTLEEPGKRYYIVNPKLATGDLHVISLADGNTITAGGAQLTLNANEQGIFPAAVLNAGLEIVGTQPFSIASEVDATDMPVPAAFAGTQFVIPHYRDDHTYYMLSPYGDANLQVDYGTGVYSEIAYQGRLLVIAAGSDNTLSGIIISDIPILVSHVAANEQYDAYPVPPAKNEIWGVRSKYAQLGALEDSTTVNIYASDGTLVENVVLNRGVRYTIAIGVGTDQGRGSAIHVVADKPIAGIQLGDSDGAEASAFLPSIYSARKYGIPVDTQYVTVVCTATDTTVTLIPPVGTADTRNCSALNNQPDKLYFGSNSQGSHIVAGSVIVSNQPIYVMYEVAATDDESNLLGYVEYHDAAIDSDNDGVVDSIDAFPTDSTEWLDTDNDGIGNNADTDDDNDTVIDDQDAFPTDPLEWEDSDNDGIGNNSDPDDDNDSFTDENDAFPLDPTEWLDTDNDGIGNNTDADDDNDGYADACVPRRRIGGQSPPCSYAA